MYEHTQTQCFRIDIYRRGSGPESAVTFVSGANLDRVCRTKATR